MDFMRHLTGSPARGVALAAILAGLGGPAAASECGIASWYAYGDKGVGKKTASGETLDHSSLTAAHKTLPFGSEVLVENLDNGRKVHVRITDRGPFVKGRIIDVTPAAATLLGIRGSGLGRVRVTALNGRSSARPRSCS